MPLKLAPENKQAEKIRKGICIVHFCTKKVVKRKCKRKPSKFCTEHEHQIEKDKNPLKYWYGVLKRNAKRRRKLFGLTLIDFKEFCDKTGYLEKKGRGVGKMTIDRIISELGYIPGNIEMKEYGANVRKRFTDYWSKQELEDDDTDYSSSFSNGSQEEALPIIENPF